jgi:Domain of unknown function (DUF4440)
MRWLFMTLATLIPSVTAFSQTGSIADQVRALDKTQREAALRGETRFEEQYTAAECVSINPAGAVSSREETIARMKSGDVKLDAIDIDQEQVHVYGETAVITGREHVRGSYKAHAFDSWARYSRVWIKQDGTWKVVLFQETPLPAPAS